MNLSVHHLQGYQRDADDNTMNTLRKLKGAQTTVDHTRPLHVLTKSDFTAYKASYRAGDNHVIAALSRKAERSKTRVAFSPLSSEAPTN